MYSNILALAQAAGPLAKMDEGKGKNSDEFECFKDSSLETVESWWDSLDWLKKIDVGRVVMHYKKMSANYKWKCRLEDKFADLTKGQKKLVKFAYDMKDRKYSCFPLEVYLTVKY